MKRMVLKIIPLILTVFLISLPCNVNAVPTQFSPAAKVELEKYELSRPEVNMGVKLQIISICLSPVIFLLCWFLIIKIKSLLSKKRKQ